MVSSRIDSYIKEEVAVFALSKEEGAGGRELRDEKFNQYMPMVP